MAPDAEREREISKGTSAFGGTKAKREIAGRPATPYGRLRAMRPGEYLLLDTTRLDVFAMDPVTLRWVQAELTAGMDLYDRCVTGLRLTPVSTKALGQGEGEDQVEEQLQGADPQRDQGWGAPGWLVRGRRVRIGHPRQHPASREPAGPVPPSPRCRAGTSHPSSR